MGQLRINTHTLSFNWVHLVNILQIGFTKTECPGLCVYYFGTQSKRETNWLDRAATFVFLILQRYSLLNSGFEIMDFRLRSWFALPPSSEVASWPQWNVHTNTYGVFFVGFDRSPWKIKTFLKLWLYTFTYSFNLSILRYHQYKNPRLNCINWTFECNHGLDLLITCTLVLLNYVPPWTEVHMTVKWKSTKRQMCCVLAPVFWLQRAYLALPRRARRCSRRLGWSPGCI